MKTKSKNNTKIASPSTVSPKNPLPVNLKNRFDNLIVTKLNEIEINESQDDSPTIHHKRCEITNSKSKSRAEKNYSHSIHLSNAITANLTAFSPLGGPMCPHKKKKKNAITANEINTKSKTSISTVPGNQSYASITKHGKKTCILGDSHIPRIKKKKI